MLRLMILACMLAATPAWADQAGAKAAYTRGAKAMAAKDYRGAVAEFEASLEEDRSYYHAHKQLGTCYYYLGLKADALEHYEAYLEKAPGDAQVASFAKSLRGAAAPAGGMAAAAHPALGTGFGVKLGLGWGFGRAIDSVGTDYSNTYGGQYAVSLGEGFVYDIEALWAFSPNWELGLGTSSMSYSKAFSSKSNLGSMPEDSTKVDASVIPIIIMLYGRIPLSDHLVGIIGFGPSYGMGPSGTYTSETKNAPSAGSTTKTTGKVTADGGLGYRAYLGGEYAFSKMFYLFFGLELHDLNLAPAKQVIESSVVNSAGRTTSESVTTIQYVDKAPQEQATVNTNSTTVSGSVWTMVSTSDDGVSNSKNTFTFNTMTGESFSRTETTQKAARTDSMDFDRLAPLIGVAMRF